MVLVSFIIPAYNASRYICRCLNSIYALNLSKEDFEVFVVDDCSTDDTVCVVRDYVSTHHLYNITVLEQKENKRQGAARNRGVSLAKGCYIVYIDSDDEIESGVVRAIELAERKGLDMVAFHSVKEDEKGIEYPCMLLPYKTNEFFSGVQLQANYPFWFTGPVAYVYQKNFLDKVNYPFEEGVLFEDSDYVNNHLFAAKKMGYVSECGYRIHHNPNSTTHTYSYKHAADYFLLGTRMLQLYDKIEDKSSKYAQSIIEGGSYNIWRSCRNLWRLKSFREVCLFYDRIDERISRVDYAYMKTPRQYWSYWTRFCLKHRVGTISIMRILCFLGRYKG